MSPITEDNRSLLHKADLVLADLVSDGGFLQPEQARKFLEIMIDESVVMGMSMVETTKSHTKLLERIGLTSPMLVPGFEGTALPEADRTKPELDKINLVTHLFKGEIRLTDETLEDNIEGGNLRTTVMNLIGGRAGLDMDDILVNGDTASAVPRLSLFDGIRKSATTNVVSNLGARLTKTTFRDSIKTLENRFQRNKMRMKFLTSVNAEIDYRDSLADRATALGDSHLNQNLGAKYNGIDVVPVPIFPEALGGGTDETEMIFADPKNFRVGIWRRVRIETERSARRGILYVVVSLRFGFVFEEEAAVVKTTVILND